MRVSDGRSMQKITCVSSVLRGAAAAPGPSPRLVLADAQRLMGDGGPAGGREGQAADRKGWYGGTDRYVWVDAYMSEWAERRRERWRDSEANETRIGLSVREFVGSQSDFAATSTAMITCF